MRIAVIGSGAMGTVFAFRLVRAGHEVTLLARRALYLEAAAARGGLSVSGEGDAESGGAERVAPCRLTLDPRDLAACELALVLVKSMHTAEAARAAAGLPPGRPVLTLQNGLGNMETLGEALADNPVLAGVTTCAATSLGPGRSRLVSAGETVLGPQKPEDKEHAVMLAALLTHAGFPASATDDPRPDLWGKLLVNIAINPLTALTGLRNGEFAASAHLRSVASAAAAEGAAVASALGIAVPDAPDRFLAVCAATAANYSSMAQDMAAGRPTEIEAMNGAVGRLGRRAGVPTPVNDTLAALVRDRETRGAAR